MAAVSAPNKAEIPRGLNKTPGNTALKSTKSSAQRVNIKAKAISGGAKKTYRDRAYNVVFTKQTDGSFTASVPIHLSTKRYGIGARLSVSCGCGGGAPTIMEVT